jgi:undecaprenyl-diphosphatase
MARSRLGFFGHDAARRARRLVVGSVSAIGHRQFADPDLRLAIGIALATVPIVLAGALLSNSLNTCNSPFRAFPVIGWACIAMAVLMGLTELLARHSRSVEKASLVDTLLVGLAQVGALIPGASRSGSTLTAALALGFKREEAARFSFLLGIPAIALAGSKEIWELHKTHLDMHGWSVLALGLVVASVSAFAAIWALMRVLERFSAWPFVIYRGTLGVLLLVATSNAWLI